MHHVMFDVDGTLVQSMDFDPALFAQAIEDVTGSTVDRKWTKYRNVTDSGILNEIISTLGCSDKMLEIEEKVKRNFVAKITDYLNHSPTKEVKGASLFLNRLSSMENTTVSIATGGWFETTKLKLKSAGLYSEKIYIASSSDHPSRTEIMKLSMDFSRSEVGTSCTYFGDAIWDKMACEELGYNFVQVGGTKFHDQWVADFTDYRQALLFIGL